MKVRGGGGGGETWEEGQEAGVCARGGGWGRVDLALRKARPCYFESAPVRPTIASDSRIRAAGYRASGLSLCIELKRALAERPNLDREPAMTTRREVFQLAAGAAATAAASAVLPTLAATESKPGTILIFG